LSIYVLSDKIVTGAKNLPAIVTKFLNIEISLEKYDAIIFTYRNGVLALNSVFTDWKKYQIFTIGNSTAESVKKLGGEALFVCDDGYAKSLADKLIKNYANLRFLYPRARTVAFDLAQTLHKNGIMIDEIVVYETQCNEAKMDPPEDNSVIIFSSPSTIECFFKRFGWRQSYKAIAIGKTTANCMPKDIVFDIAPQRSLDSAVEFAMSNFFK
jgi:uroporphyrinogen-III synthase